MYTNICLCHCFHHMYFLFSSTWFWSCHTWHRFCWFCVF